MRIRVVLIDVLVFDLGLALAVLGHFHATLVCYACFTGWTTAMIQWAGHDD